jgi:hypothetical protein
MANIQFSTYTDQQVALLLSKPHLIGHLGGKTKLTQLHSDWINYMWDPAARFRAIQGHRGSYKTTAMAAGVIRQLLLEPDSRGAIIRKTFTLAAEVMEMIHAMIMRPELQLLFKYAVGTYPKARVKRSGKITYNFKWSLTPEGSLNAHGLDGSLTGTHYDWIWLDDFVDLRDRVSRAERLRTIDILREIVTNIVDPGKPVRFSGTPWHRNDAWTAVPTPPLKFPVDTCGILTLEQIAEKQRITTPALYAANYDLSLDEPEGALFSDPQYRNWNYLDHDAPVAQLDAAFDGDHYCALTIMAKMNGVIGDAWQVQGWVYPGNVKDWISDIVKICRSRKVRLIYIESNADKGYTADQLVAAGMAVQSYPEHQNKHIKISTRLYAAWKSIYWDPDTDPEYMNQIIDYREGSEPDDAPDSAASLLREAYQIGSADQSALSQW